MLAAVASRIQPNLETCAELVEGAATEDGGKILIEPEPLNAGVYESAYACYNRLFESLKPMF
jgi:hypothetical protein